MSELTTKQDDLDYRFSMIDIVHYRNPLRWEVIRHVIPALIAAFFFGLLFAYGRAKAAYQFIR